MQIEDVSRVGLTARRAAEQQGHLAVCHSLLGQVVVHGEGRVAGVAEELADGRSRERSVELQRSRVGCRCRHHDRVGHGTGFLQRLHDASHRRAFLADGDVDAVHGLAAVVEFLLVDDGVDGHRRLSGLAVTDDELTLASVIGIMESMALMPVCSGSFTGWR